MLYGNQYLYVAADRSTDTKHFNVGLLFLSLSIHIENKYIMFVISFFNKADINITFVLN